jgi:YegS/Rv2252/BmrU family lipid kinase
MKVAVIAHSGKTFGGGLPELRRVLRAEGVTDPLWCEVPKAKRAPREVRRALKEGADLVFAWGGDGMVRRCIDVLAGTKTSLAILPAGTSNLFATNLGIPRDIQAAVEIGLRGAGRKVDVGCFNGERFAVMAGAGFDAAMIRDADDLKDRLGRAAYVIGGSRTLNAEAFATKIKVDGVGWYEGPATCVLLGNVGDLFGGIEVFEDSRPDDGLLELGVVTAEGPVEMVRTVMRTVVGTASKSPFVRTTKAHSVKVSFDRKVRYELDGGGCGKAKSFTVQIEPAAMSMCVPDSSDNHRKAT